MLSCKELVALASDYLDKETNSTLTWKIRMHLLVCGHCRTFVRHLDITRKVCKEAVKEDAEQSSLAQEPEKILAQLQARNNQEK